VQLKKSLGQHFLKDMHVLDSIILAIDELQPIETMIEVGPGMGALSSKLINLNYEDYYLIEKDDRFVEQLPVLFPRVKNKIFHQDVLTFDFSKFNRHNLTIVGNYPYNISNQIVFWILENESFVKQSVGMFQKEVGMRIASQHGKKDYGILSVLSQSLYDVQYLFDIPPEAFDPPPKVTSGVIRMVHLEQPRADFAKLKKLVKAAFNQRRKMLSNSLKGIQFSDDNAMEVYNHRRPEQMSVEDFCNLSQYVI
jgi:16S rRNA (adenine1518-N6/adenine1519-N6)-dimethyltransferase